MRQKWIRIILGICITVLVLWLSFKKIEWDVLKESFLKVNLFWIILALANTIFTVYALGWRWQILLKTKEKVSLNRLFRLNIISHYFNIIIPGRFGEIIKAYLVSKQSRISGAYVMGTVVIERILDFFVFVVLWVLVPAFLAIQKEVKGYRTALFFCLLSASFLAIFILRPDAILKWTSFLSSILPKNLRKKVINFFEQGMEAFDQLRSSKTFFSVVVLTFFFVVVQVLTNFFLFRAFDLKLSFWVGLVVLLAIQVGHIPPSVPGKIGVFEYAVILALSVFNISKGQALSYGIMLHVVTYMPRILLGFIFILNLKAGLRIRDYRKLITQEGIED